MAKFEVYLNEDIVTQVFIQKQNLAPLMAIQKYLVQLIMEALNHRNGKLAMAAPISNIKKRPGNYKKSRKK